MAEPTDYDEIFARAGKAASQSPKPMQEAKMRHIPAETIRIDHKKLEFILAQLRHAYEHLVNGRVKDHKQFADGLIAPQIAKIEEMLK